MTRAYQPVYRERMSRVAAPYLAPWVGSVALVPAAEITRLAWDTPSAAPWAALAMGSGTLAMTAVARAAARPRGELVRTLATATALAAGGWWTAATFAGPLSHPVIDLWGLSSVILAGSWNTLRTLGRAGVDLDLGDGLEGLARRVRTARRARVRGVRVDGPRIEADVETPAGVPIDDFLRDPGAIAAGLDVPRSWVRASESAESARRGTIAIVPDDLLEQVHEWQPSAAGASIADPLRIGVAEDGQTLEIWLPGDDRAARPATNFIVAGMSGAGKTETVLTIAGEVLTRVDVEMMWIDWVKGLQSYFPVAHGLTHIASTEAQAKTLLRELVHEVLPERTRWLGERGLKQWARGCGMPYLVVVVGEASSVPGDLLTPLAERCRSAGMSLIIDVQRVSHDRIKTSGRANFGGLLAHGMLKAREARETVSAAAWAAGARPDAWANAHPGYLYAEAPGLDRKRLGVKHRAFYADVERLRAAVPARERVEVDAEPEAARMSTGEARALVDERIAALRGEGATRVMPADFAGELARAGRSAAWLTGELQTRCVGEDAPLQALERNQGYSIRGQR